MSTAGVLERADACADLGRRLAPPPDSAPVAQAGTVVALGVALCALAAFRSRPPRSRRWSTCRPPRPRRHPDPDRPLVVRRRESLPSARPVLLPDRAAVGRR